MLKEFKEMGFGMIIMNFYIIYKILEFREKVFEVGIYKFFDYDGIIEVDLGLF